MNYFFIFRGKTSFQNFTLMQTFPKIDFTESHLQQSFLELKLVPTAVLRVIPVRQRLILRRCYVGFLFCVGGKSKEVVRAVYMSFLFRKSRLRTQKNIAKFHK